MDDTLRDSATAVLGLLIFTGFLHHRAERAIVRDVSRTAVGGTFGARVDGRGLLGLAIGQADTVFVTGRHFRSEGFPFTVRRGEGIRAYVRTLRIDFTDFTLRGIPVRRFEARIPGTSIDAGRAFFDERIVMRTAGEGTAEAVVGPEALGAIFARKFPQYKNVRIRLRPGFVDVEADVSALGAPLKLESTSMVGLREGRYVVLESSVMKLNGKDASPQFVESVHKTVNPVLDTDKDLGLGAYFYARALEVSDGILTVRGAARMPIAPMSPEAKEQEKRP
jgi:hypothetical protein